MSIPTTTPVTPSAPSGLRVGIDQTAQCAVALGRIFNGVKKAKENDGKVSGFEVFKMAVFNVGAIGEAIVGIAQVPEELGDITTPELDDVVGVLIREGVIIDDAEKAAKLNILIDAVSALMTARHKWLNIGASTPVAEVPPEEAV